MRFISTFLAAPNADDSVDSGLRGSIARRELAFDESVAPPRDAGLFCMWAVIIFGGGCLLVTCVCSSLTHYQIWLDERRNRQERAARAPSATMENRTKATTTKRKKNDANNTILPTVILMMSLLPSVSADAEPFGYDNRYFNVAWIVMAVLITMGLVCGIIATYKERKETSQSSITTTASPRVIASGRVLEVRPTSTVAVPVAAPVDELQC